MSDPTELYFCVSVGFFSNHRKIALERLIGERANFIPQMLWAYASLNQRNGDFSSYTHDDYQRIFQAGGLRTSIKSAEQIVQALRTVGFLDKSGQLHSWTKFNKFFSKARFRKAARAKWKKQRQMEREALLLELRQSRATNGSGGAKLDRSPSPLWRTIESTEKIIAAKKKELDAIRVPKSVWDEEKKLS